MAPQLYITMYKEQFASPGRAKRERPRPTSAHRRNNPQPRPDFLFPRTVHSNYRSRRTISQPLPPVETGRPLFPPVRHLSFLHPVTTCPGNYLNTVDTGKPNLMPPVNQSTLHALPSADGLQKLQLPEPPAGAGFQPHTALKNPARMDYQRNVHPLSAQQLRQHAGAHLRTRPQTSNPPAGQHHFPLTQYRRSSSNSSLDYSGCYSCFHVVKPYQAGHYIIHPEFVSECLR
ncbi:uncharacterized protein LOC127372135 [Dicentrarchus labrax]|uniref:Uncharacterized protein n=1 Tax=Dicentrarchus labrax TaxID=13489 RepID=E6ZG32_DICLA|nr:uncharacterized protein LOC127372135 [Dicentrarchus labrax]CBN81132.1 Uncharacterized protein [Dicentrarchus labrax]